MAAVMSVEERIVAKFVQKLESDQKIPKEVLRRLLLLWEEGKLKDPEAIIRAIREGVHDHAENSTA